MKDWLLDIVGIKKRNTRKELIAEIQLLNRQYDKLSAAFSRLFGDWEQSEKNVEELRQLCVRQREEIAMLEPQREAGERRHALDSAVIRQEFLNDTVVRGLRWGDMTEQQRAEVTQPTETSLRAALRLLESKVIELESQQPVSQ